MIPQGEAMNSAEPNRIRAAHAPLLRISQQAQFRQYHEGQNPEHSAEHDKKKQRIGQRGNKTAHDAPPSLNHVHAQIQSARKICLRPGAKQHGFFRRDELAEGFIQILPVLIGGNNLIHDKFQRGIALDQAIPVQFQ